MKKKIFVFIILLMVVLLSGCKEEEALSEAAYIYTAESIGNIGNTSSISWVSIYGEDIYLSLTEFELSIIDGFEVNMPVSSFLIKYNNDSGKLQSLSYEGEPDERMIVSPAGDFWVLCNNVLLKLGAEFEIIDQFDIPVETETAWLSPVFDAEGSLYLYTYASMSDKVIVLDLSSGKPELIFSLSAPGKIMGMSAAADKSIAVKYSNPDGDYVQFIDVDMNAWGKSISLDRQLSLVQNPGDELYLQNENDVIALDIATGELTNIFNWVYCGLYGGDLLAPLPDGSFLAQRGNAYAGDDVLLELIKPVESAEAPVVLRLASDNGSQFHNLLSDFNRDHDDVKIELLDYSIYRTGTGIDGISGSNYAGLTRLIADLTSGMSIDIIDLNSISVEKYVKSGKLVDLYPYIDADQDLNRDDFFENTLGAMEIDGGLYEVTPRVNILSLLADSELAGTEPGWTIDEMKHCVDSGADRPGGPFPFTNTSLYILDTFLQFYMNDLIDWTTGAVNFNTKEFLFALELANLYPMEHDYNNLPDDAEVMQGYLASFYSISTPYDPIGTWEPYNIVKGLPVNEGIGNAATGVSSLGLMSMSSHKEQAWEFMRRFLLPDGAELGYGEIGFSINKNRFEHDIETGAGRVYSPEEMELFGFEYLGGKESNLGDWARELVLSVSRIARKDESIQSIVAEEASAYFAGEKTAAEIVKLIDSRVRLYVAE